MSFVVTTGVRLGILAMATIACFPRVSLAEAACPCSDGYVCCANRCIDPLSPCDGLMDGQAVSGGESAAFNTAPQDAPTPVVKAEGSSVKIQRALAPTLSCTYSTGNSSQGYGIYDSNLDYLSGGPDGYHLALLVRNDTQEVDTDIDIVGVEGCWYQYQGVAQLGNDQPSAIVDCTTIPKQSGFIPVAQEVDAGEGQQILTLQVLQPGMLRSIFGSDFDMSAVYSNPANYTAPHVAGNVGNQNVLLSTYFNNSLAAPSNTATRDPNWGQNYPTSLNAPIIVQLRALYTDQDGVTGRSNWFPYLINFCPTCLSSPCGFNTFITCPTAACVDRSICGQGGYNNAANPPYQMCLNGDQCSNLIAAEYHTATYINACLPSQGDTGTSITCNTTNACPTIN